MKKNIILIAEIGINHNGDISIAKKLIDQAKEAGFDAVKFQKRTIDIVYTQEQLDTPRESPWGTSTREQKYGLEFEKKEYDEIDKYCKQKNIIWFASAWDTNSLKFLGHYDLKYHKIASAMIVDQNFLIEVAKRKKHTFISTGMSETTDITNAVNIFNKENCSFELMHCVSTYPMNVKDANLATMEALTHKFNCNVGWSGHENGIAVSVCAAVLGASSIERHITLDRTMYGSDQSASIEFKGMKEMVSQIDIMRTAIGEEKIGHILDEELPIAKKLRAHLNNL
ncbi:N-acetylneuraminate synthase family protein [Candidatus Pelagibacter sp.]|jgi:N-acetylneuraminate synthase|nr:N-acetylneuraminate synthase family protein [Candidatus Pelagibacter sp.]